MEEKLQNVKAEAWQKFLEENKINAFKVEQAADELKSVAFRSTIDTNGQKLPIVVIIDNSIYIMTRVQIAARVVNDKNRTAVSELINEYNMKYKAFKYYISPEGDVGLDSCMIFTEENFDPNLVRALLQILLQHIEAEYPNVMHSVWG